MKKRWKLEQIKKGYQKMKQRLRKRRKNKDQKKLYVEDKNFYEVKGFFE